MSIQAPLHSLDRATVAAVDDDPTAPLDAAATETVTQALPLLDHRGAARTVPPHLAPRGAYLALEGDGETRLVALAGRTIHIGRGLCSDLRFEDPRVSRSHAIVACHGRHPRLLDNRSSTGTFVNGRRVLADTLHDGDVVRLGPVELRYVEVR